MSTNPERDLRQENIRNTNEIPRSQSFVNRLIYSRNQDALNPEIPFDSGSGPDGSSPDVPYAFRLLDAAHRQESSEYWKESGITDQEERFRVFDRAWGDSLTHLIDSSEENSDSRLLLNALGLTGGDTIAQQVAIFREEYISGGVEVFIEKLKALDINLANSSDVVIRLSGMFGKETGLDVAAMLLVSPNHEANTIFEPLEDEKEASRLRYLATLAKKFDAMDMPVESELKTNLPGFGVESLQGSREYQEDRAGVFRLEFGDGKLADLAMIFDGHGGDAVSQYALDNFPTNLKLYLDMGKTPQDAIKLAFAKLESDIFDDNQGSTAAIMLRIGDDTYVANLGDSEIIGISGESVDTLSRAHTLEEPSIRNLVKEKGGEVYFSEDDSLYRLRDANGNGIAVGGSLGDGGVPGMLKEPFIQKVEGGYDYIIIGSDGLFTGEKTQISQAVRSYKASNPNATPQEISEALAEFGLGSGDNVSVIVFEANKKK